MEAFWAGRGGPWRRSLTAVVPAAVWLMAIAAGIQLYLRGPGRGVVTGYANDVPVILRHGESTVVRDVYVQVYEEVQRGQLLVGLDDRRERIRLAAIEKDLARMRAEVGAEEARLSADNARATADVTDLSRRFAIDREDARIEYLSQLVVNARDRILLCGAQAEYEIVKRLEEQGDAAFRELNAIETEVEALEATLRENAPVLAQKKTTFEEADRRWARFRYDEQVAMAYEPILTPLRLAIDVRERDLEEILRQLDTHALRAPIKGQVTAVWVSSGDHVEAGVPLVSVSPTYTNEVIAYLPEELASSARIGAPVSVECLAVTEDGRRRYTGKIVRASATISQAPLRCWRVPTYPEWRRGFVIELDGDARLMPGEATRVAFLDWH